MNKIITFLFLMTIIATGFAQRPAYGDGEYFKFRVHYGFVTAGYATIEVNQKTLNGAPVYHIKGKGKTSGLSRAFFKVDDDYQSYVAINKNVPLRFIRKIDEGGHTKDIQIDFDHNEQKATVNNKKYDKTDVVSFPKDAQDMVSAFYYLRNYIDVSKVKDGDVVDLNMFFDKENYKFRLKFLGRDTLSTEFGKVPALKFRPYVEAGRIFKEKESLTVWVTDDDNKMPLLIKADLAVGSLKATLTEFKGLKHQFKILVD